MPERRRSRSRRGKTMIHVCGRPATCVHRLVIRLVLMVSEDDSSVRRLRRRHHIHIVLSSTYRSLGLLGLSNDFGQFRTPRLRTQSLLEVLEQLAFEFSPVQRSGR